LTPELNSAAIIRAVGLTRSFGDLVAVDHLNVEVTRGETVEILSENQSTYIPVGEKHRLANPGKIPAFLIEVQSGAYLNEDDIVRYDDVYHRNSSE